MSQVDILYHKSYNLFIWGRDYVIEIITYAEMEERNIPYSELRYKQKVAIYKELVDEYVVLDKLDVYFITRLYLELNDEEFMNIEYSNKTKKVLRMARDKSEESRDSYSKEVFNEMYITAAKKGEDWFDWDFIIKEEKKSIANDDKKKKIHIYLKR